MCLLLLISLKWTISKFIDKTMFLKLLFQVPYRVRIRVGSDIRPYSISDRIPDIANIWPDIRESNILYFTTNILLNK